VAIPLLRAKLYVPPVRPGLVSRPRLVERLDEGLRTGRKLTLISAPAGFGKTTLVSEWAAGYTPDMRIAWVSLDKGDNDLARFLTYVVIAIQTVESGLGTDVLAMMQSLQPPAAEMMLATLIDDLAEHPSPLCSFWTITTRSRRNPPTTPCSSCSITCPYRCTWPLQLVPAGPGRWLACERLER
jgi:LuxR family maltose regulon positive regulatory protein